MGENLKAHLALLTVAIVYGANFTIAKEVLSNNYIEPLGFIVLRVFSGILFFWTFHHFFVKEKIDRKDIKRFFLCSIFGVAINQIFFFSGLQRTSPINASLLMMTAPILVLLILAIAKEEIITPKKVLGVVIGCTGAFILIAYGSSFEFQRSGFIGDVMIMINALSYGIYLVLVKKLMQRYHPVTVVKWIFFFGFFLVLPFGFKDLQIIEWQSFPSYIWWAIAYVLVFATWLTYLFNAFALSKVNTSVVSTYIYLQPLIATIIALGFGKDEMNFVKFLAAMAIFLGVFLVSFQEKSPKVAK